MIRWSAVSEALGLDGGGELASPQAANLRNMFVLTQLRWLAVAGQLITIAVVQLAMGVDLPLFNMLAAPVGLALVTIVSLPILRRRRGASDAELFMALLVDVGALTWLLALSGGITNPFAPLFLLQVVLGAVLLAPAYAWALVGITSLCAVGLSLAYRPLHLSPRPGTEFFDLYLQGTVVCFVLVSVLLVLFVTRINRNLKERDAFLADLRQTSAEQGHIVRIGLLASGAAHELGTPLASLAVILSDWRRMPAFRKPELATDIAVMQAEVDRCKTIVSGILMAAGEARGQAPELTSLHAFLGEVARDWQARRPEIEVDLALPAERDPPIVSDPAMRQAITALFDNAVEAGARRVDLTASLGDGGLAIAVGDDGRGFPPHILSQIGQPYRSTKTEAGAGLGLFLLVNILRTLGGTVEASNKAGGGALVEMRLPLSALALPERSEDG